MDRTRSADGKDILRREIVVEKFLPEMIGVADRALSETAIVLSLGLVLLKWRIVHLLASTNRAATASPSEEHTRARRSDVFVDSLR